MIHLYVSKVILLLLLFFLLFQLKYQEAAELLARKAHISSEEARLQGEKALEIEAQLERCKYEMNRVCFFFSYDKSRK